MSVTRTVSCAAVGSFPPFIWEAWKKSWRSRLMARSLQFPLRNDAIKQKSHFCLILRYCSLFQSRTAPLSTISLIWYFGLCLHLQNNLCKWVIMSRIVHVYPNAYCVACVPSPLFVKVKDKSVPLQAWSGPEGSRKLSLPDFMTAQGCGKVVSLTHRPHLPTGNSPGTHFC